MKVEIKPETYVKCDICGQRIDHRKWYNIVYQIKVRSVERNRIGRPFRKVDMCNDCYEAFSARIRKELKEAEEKK